MITCISIRQGHRVEGTVSKTRFEVILRELKRDGYFKAFHILRSAFMTLKAGETPAPFTEDDTTALHIACGATANTRLLLSGRYWYGSVLELTQVP